MNLMNKMPVSSLIFVAVIVFTLAACNQNRPVVPEPVDQPVSNGQMTFTADSFAYYESLLLQDSANMELRLALGVNYYSERQFDKAIGHLLKVVTNDPKNQEALITLGNVFYDTGQFENAITYYEKALALNDKNVDVRCDLATCYLNLKQPEKSLSLLKKNLAIDPDHAQSHHNLSVVYRQMGRTIEADEQMKVFNALGK